MLKYKTKAVIVTIFLTVPLNSCIEFYQPDIGKKNPTNYVIDGSITDNEGIQTVLISTTSTMHDPNFNPLKFCKVEVIDDKGNSFTFNESAKEPGKYTAWIGKDYLKSGTSYQLKVVTAGGDEITSTFDQMPECPEIDSVYYKRKDIPTSDPDKTLEGLQFYIDFDKGNTNSTYYKWEIEETWEHHSTYPITWHYNKEDGWVCNLVPDYSKSVCYTTKKLDEFFTLTTESFTAKKFPLNAIHYVDNQTQRLTFCYSALVSQYAISQLAFSYWDNLRKISSEQGGLYSNIPVKVKGNLKCVNNPKLEILGFFGAYSIKSKRIFIQKLDDVMEDFDVCEPSCAPPYLEDPEFPEVHKYEISINDKRYILPDACVECNYMSGSTKKPEFWPL